MRPNARTNCLRTFLLAPGKKQSWSQRLNMREGTNIWIFHRNGCRFFHLHLKSCISWKSNGWTNGVRISFKPTGSWWRMWTPQFVRFRFRNHPKSKFFNLTLKILSKISNYWRLKPWKPQRIGSNHFFRIFGNPYMDVNNHAGDVNKRKAFGLRSNYVQITFKLRSITFKLRKNYVKIT